MADYIGAEIIIGGKISKDDVPRLLEQLKMDQLIDEEDINDVLENNRGTCPGVDEGCLVLRSEARYGEYDELEPLLRELGMSYQRISDGYAEIEAECVWWYPGMPEDSQYSGLQMFNNMMNAVVPLGNVKKLIRATKRIKSLKDAPLYVNSEDGYEKQYAEYVLKNNEVDPGKYLNEFIEKEFPDPPPVPPFEVV